MSEQSKRDNNGVSVALGSDGVGGTKQFRLDPATHRLLIDISFVSDVAPPVFPITAPRDNNGVTVGLAVTDDANKTPRPLIIDSRNGYLFCDIIFE